MKRLLEKCIVNSLYSNDVTAVNYKTIVFDEDDQVSQKCLIWALHSLKTFEINHLIKQNYQPLK